MDNKTPAAPSAERKENKVLLFSMVAVLVAVVIIAILGFLLLSPPDEVIEGQADATSIRISGKMPGRVADIYVHEGDFVRKGDTLIHIHSSLVDARLDQARQMHEAALAQESKVDEGTRSQIVATAQSLVDQAQAAADIARKTYDRMQNLFKEGVVSEQKRDEAKAAYDAAKAALQAAESQLSLARQGPQSQDRKAAAAIAGAAGSGVSEVESILEDQYLTAPADGQIDQVYPQVSELVMTGAPLMSLLLTSDKWVTFNVREELLPQFKLGEEIEIMIPAIEERRFKARIYYSRSLGSYATWQATKSTGQWDSKTFEIKARPVDSIPELRPGMTVVYTKK